MIWINGTINRRSGITTVDWMEGLLHNNQLSNKLWWAESVVVRYKHVAIYFCAQTVFEKTLYMGMSLVKALIVKVFRARRKKTITNVMCMHLYQAGKKQLLRR